MMAASKLQCRQRSILKKKNDFYSVTEKIILVYVKPLRGLGLLVNTKNKNQEVFKMFNICTLNKFSSFQK